MLVSRFKRYFHQWAARRAPRSLRVVLQHRTIYVFPGLQGIGFLFVVLLIWILGTNYQNNLILALSFFLISMMLVSAIHGFKNLLGLTFTPAAVQHATVGEMAPFDIVVSSQYTAQHHGLLFQVNDEDYVRLDLTAGETATLRLMARASERGWMRLPRISLKSYFPLGLFRIWAYIELDHRALIFPQSIACDKPPLGVGQGDEGSQLSSQSGDEFQGFQAYQPGAPLSRIAWKHVARGAGLHLKDYRALQSQHHWLDWNEMQARDTELRLSYLSYWVNQLADTQQEYGLLMPSTRIELGSGEVHRLQALTALALFEREEKT